MKKHQGLHPHTTGWMPLSRPLCMAGSLFLFPQIIPGLHTPGSRAPKGKRLKNSKSQPGTIGEPVQLWLSVSLPCQAVCSTWGTPKSLPGLQHNSRKQKGNTPDFPETENWVFYSQKNPCFSAPKLLPDLMWTCWSNGPSNGQC